MRLADYDGYQTPPPLRGRLLWWTLTHWLIAVNVAVYIFDLLSRGLLSRWGAFSIEEGIFHFQLWRLITYNFLHASPGHLLFNMISLWAFGPSVELTLRRYRYLAFYLFNGLGGVAGYLLLWRLRFLEVTTDSTMVGASACIFGVIMAAAHLSPHRIVRLIWPPVMLRFRTLAWLLIGFAVLVIAARGENAGGQAAHLGGALLGYILIRNLHWFSAIGLAPRRRRFWKPGDRASNFFRSDV
jgi:membrane associated rhomboid family serine protease